MSRDAPCALETACGRDRMLGAVAVLRVKLGNSGSCSLAVRTADRSFPPYFIAQISYILRYI